MSSVADWIVAAMSVVSTTILILNFISTLHIKHNTNSLVQTLLNNQAEKSEAKGRADQRAEDARTSRN